MDGSAAAIIIGAFGVLFGAFGRIGYSHIMTALDKAELRDRAMAKRVIRYERTNNDQHHGIVQRLAYLEAILNGHGKSKAALAAKGAGR